jgi:hypothetical protein
MARQQYEIDGRTFRSKKAVIDYVRAEIHGASPDGEPLNEEHLGFMVALLRRHPWSDQKIGAGVARMWIEQNPDFPTRCFWLERADGTKTDFSFYQCLEDSSPLRDFKEACRHAVAPDVIEFKAEFFRRNPEACCPVTGEPMTFSTSHVDHAPPDTFDAILGEYVKSRSIDPAKVRFVAHGDGDIGSRFDDDRLEKDWVEFHDRRAKLRVISAVANLSAKRSPNP